MAERTDLSNLRGLFKKHECPSKLKEYDSKLKKMITNRCGLQIAQVQFSCFGDTLNGRFYV